MSYPPLNTSCPLPPPTPSEQFRSSEQFRFTIPMPAGDQAGQAGVSGPDHVDQDLVDLVDDMTMSDQVRIVSSCGWAVCNIF